MTILQSQTNTVVAANNNNNYVIIIIKQLYVIGFICV